MTEPIQRLENQIQALTFELIQTNQSLLLLQSLLPNALTGDSDRHSDDCQETRNRIDRLKQLKRSRTTWGALTMFPH